jgi:hypothetical protein
MMQTADLRNRQDRTGADWPNRPRDRSVLPQRQMRAGSFVVVEVRFQDAPKASLIEHDDVIQALATNRSDQSLDISQLEGIGEIPLHAPVQIRLARVNSPRRHAAE